MSKILVAGIGTDVGKTIVSAILTTLMKGDYWKPIQYVDGENSDTAMMKSLIDTTKHTIHPSTYSLRTPLSPHHAARLEGITIDPDLIIPPETTRTLIIESVGGIYVPLTTTTLSMDLFKAWDCLWVIVSRHYLGSINHTLLTVDALKRQDVSIAGLIFNGEPNHDSEEVILKISQLPLLGRLLPEANVDLQTIYRYATQWQPIL